MHLHSLHIASSSSDRQCTDFGQQSEVGKSRCLFRPYGNGGCESGLMGLPICCPEREREVVDAGHNGCMCSIAARCYLSLFFLASIHVRAFTLDA